MLAACGQQAEARGAYSDALARVESGERVSLARLYRKIGTSWQTHHRHGNALAAYRAAEAALAEDGDASWWQEWFQLQNDRIYVHYWLAQVDQITALVERVRPVVQERGTPLQRAVFFDGVLHMWLRRQRYQLGDQALDAAHQALDAALASGDAACMASARFMLGLALLFAGELGELERADIEMTRAVEDAERIGDVTLLSRCVTYAALIARRRGRVDDTERLAERSLALAQEARMLDYVGAARANLAWVAWRRNDIALARAHSEAALEPWDKLAKSYPYGMQWPGRLLLILLELDDEHLKRAVGHARVLLDQVQVALPAALARALAAATTAWDAGDRDRARDELARAVRVARDIGYL
jgi:tetratricopeptide (TPR) repeat protein